MTSMTPLGGETESKKVLIIHLSLIDSHFSKQRIRSLENQLDKTVIKYNEAQSIKKTYEQIVKRLNVRLLFPHFSLYMSYLGRAI